MARGLERALAESDALQRALGEIAACLAAGLSLDSALLRIQTHQKLSDAQLRLLTGFGDFLRLHGSPSAAALIRMQQHSAHLAESLRIALIASRSARLTATLIASVPLLAALGFQAIGIPVLTILVSHPIAATAAALGAVLILWGRSVMLQLAERAIRFEQRAGLELELMSLVLESGAHPAAAERSARHALMRMFPERAPHVTLPSQPEEGSSKQQLAQLYQLNRQGGVPLARLLSQAACAAQREELSGLKTRIALLPTRLLIPIGVLVLPGFLLSAVVPAALAVLFSTGG